MAWPFTDGLDWVTTFLKSLEGGLTCIWFRTVGFPVSGGGGVDCGKVSLSFVHNLSHPNARVSRKAPTGWLIKPTDDRAEALAEGSNEEVFRLGAKAGHPERARADQRDADDGEEQQWLGH